MVIVSWVLAASSMMIWEKWLELKQTSAPRALVKHPEVVKVHTNTRKWYKYFNEGKWKSLLRQLQMGLMLSLIFRWSYDLAYMRYISSALSTLRRRSVISSHAALEFAQTNTWPAVDRTISSIAAHSVPVLPVPAGPNSKYGSGKFFALIIFMAAARCSSFNFDANTPLCWAQSCLCNRI